MTSKPNYNIGDRVIHKKGKEGEPFANSKCTITTNSSGKWKNKHGGDHVYIYYVITDNKNVMGNYITTWLKAENLELDLIWYREQRLKKLLEE